MTEVETGHLCDMLVDQVGVKPDEMMKSLALWKSNLLVIDYPKAQESLKILMMERVNSKTAGGWLSAIIKHCGGTSLAQVQQRIVDSNPGCLACQFSGCVEVPHRSDWREGKWRGWYTMVVACQCAAGQLRACQMMNVRQYESLFPQWKEEYPKRQMERQLRALESKEPPTEKKALDMHNARMSALRKQIDFIDGEVPDFEPAV